VRKEAPPKLSSNCARKLPNQAHPMRRLRQTARHREPSTKSQNNTVQLTGSEFASPGDLPSAHHGASSLGTPYSCNSQTRDWKSCSLRYSKRMLCASSALLQTAITRDSSNSSRSSRGSPDRTRSSDCKSTRVESCHIAFGPISPLKSVNRSAARARDTIAGRHRQWQRVIWTRGPTESEHMLAY